MTSKQTTTCRIKKSTLAIIKKDMKENEKMADVLDKKLRCLFRVVQER